MRVSRKMGRSRAGGRFPWLRVLVVGSLITALSGTSVLTATAASAASPVTGQVTRGSDTHRTNWYSDQPNLSPATVGSASFGKLFDTALNGQIMGQPEVANGILVVATENNFVYGLDPETGAILWTQQFGTPYDPTQVGCGDLVPNVGITSTPVIDTTTNTIYVVANEVLSGVDTYRLHALDLTTGAEKANFPTALQGTADNRDLTFDATHQTQRPGLLLLDGVIYVGFSAHCQVPNWSGWVMGVNATSGAITARWANHQGDTLQGSGGGIWMAGGGLASDGTGQILLAIGNALTPNGGPYTKDNPPDEISNAVARLVVQPDGTLQMMDFFVPKNENFLDQNDLDLGSGGLALLPSQFGAGTSTPNLAVVSGKSGYVYLLDRDNLGGEQQGPNGDDAVVGTYGPNGGVWSQPSVWGGDGGYIYLPTASPPSQAWGSSGNLVAYKYGVGGNGKPVLTKVATSSETWGFGSSAVMVTSNGTTSGSALLWAIKSVNQGSGQGVPGAELVAYNAVPTNGNFTKVFSYALGTANKFTPPGIGPNGRVYASTYAGHVLGFGAPLGSGLTPTDVVFPTTSIGSSASQTATFTATDATTVMSLTTAAPFSVTAGSIKVNNVAKTLPVTLAAGQKLTATVKFTPTVAGAAAGALTATTSLGQVAANLTGTGQTVGPALSVSTNAVDFGTAAVNGGVVTNAVTLTNTGSQTLTINSVTTPGNPFSATGLPADGSTLAAGASVSVTLSFTPTTTGSFSSSMVIASTGGTQTVTLAGTGSTPGVLQITPLTLDYGNVAVGTSKKLSFALTNTGGAPVTISVSKAPFTADFHATTTLGEGTSIAGGSTITETVAFSPTTAGNQTDTWQITGTDGQGPRNVTFTGSGTGSGISLPAVGSAGWSLNGSAVTVSGGVKLTAAGATSYVAGSSFYATPVATSNFSASFDAQLSGGGGIGADGLTLTFADPASANANSLGAIGGGLGFSGITGVAVALDTFQGGVDPSDNFVGITGGPITGKTDQLNWLATNATAQVPNLRSGTIHVTVTAIAGVLTVTINGTQVLSKTVTLPANAYIGFTAGSGYYTDNHIITNTVITAGGSGGGGTPTPATLKITNTVNAPTGSPQASATSVFTGTCPTGFTTQALGNGGQSSPSVPTAVAGSSCTITTPALGTGWSTAVSVNGGAATTLVPSGNTVTVPAFAMTAGLNTVAFTSTYTPSGGGGTTTLPAVGSAGWSLNGSAVTVSGGVKLTAAGATSYVAGSSFYATPVATSNFSASFDAQLSGGGGIGADGLTLTFADPASANANSLGAIGGGLGFSGITGVAVALDTFQGGVDPSDNFVGITGGPITGKTDQLNWLATNATAQVPNLRSGTIHVTVTAIAGVLTVTINGTQVLSKTVTLPANAYIGFTAGSGYYTDNHIITNTVITVG